jgi:hypothetical protein
MHARRDIKNIQAAEKRQSRVILNEVKDLNYFEARFFALLRMTVSWIFDFFNSPYSIDILWANDSSYGMNR